MKNWNEIRNAENAEIMAWAAVQPWAVSMRTCVQDTEYHAEGDVWTHTCMVAAELEKMVEWPQLSRDEQLQLLFTAIFHDTGKPATVVIDAEGKVHTPRHSLVSTGICRRELQRLECGLATRESICGLVRYHGRPVFLQHAKKPEDELISLSWITSQRLLHLFALADFRGRISKSSNRTEDDLHLWKLVAEENNCLDQPYAFTNDHARFLYFRKKLSSLFYTPVEEYRCTVTIMAGLPGAGKDTWLARNRPGLKVVSLDDLRRDWQIDPTDNQGKVIQAGRERCRAYLREGIDFAFNATNTIKMTRMRWIDLCAEYDARIEIVYIEPPLDEIFCQNSGRKEPVPTAVIQKLADKIEPPDWTECHSLLMVCG